MDPEGATALALIDHNADTRLTAPNDFDSDPRLAASVWVPVAAFALLTLVSGIRLIAHRPRGDGGAVAVGTGTVACGAMCISGNRKFLFHFFLFIFAAARLSSSVLAAALPLLEAKEPGVIANSLAGCSYITLLLFLEMHWREILEPLSSVKARRVLISWASFWALNAVLYVAVVVSIYVEYSRSKARGGSEPLYWSNALVDILLVLIAVSYTSTAVALYVRISRSLHDKRRPVGAMRAAGSRSYCNCCSPRRRTRGVEDGGRRGGRGGAASASIPLLMDDGSARVRADTTADAVAGAAKGSPVAVAGAAFADGDMDDNRRAPLSMDASAAHARNQRRWWWQQKQRPEAPLAPGQRSPTAPSTAVRTTRMNSRSRLLSMSGGPSAGGMLSSEGAVSGSSVSPQSATSPLDRGVGYAARREAVDVGGSVTLSAEKAADLIAVVVESSTGGSALSAAAATPGPRGPYYSTRALASGAATGGLRPAAPKSPKSPAMAAAVPPQYNGEPLSIVRTVRRLDAPPSSAHSRRANGLLDDSTISVRIDLNAVATAAGLLALKRSIRAIMTRSLSSAASRRQLRDALRVFIAIMLSSAALICVRASISFVFG